MLGCCGDRFVRACVDDGRAATLPSPYRNEAALPRRLAVTAAICASQLAAVLTIGGATAADVSSMLALFAAVAGLTLLGGDSLPTTGV